MDIFTSHTTHSPQQTQELAGTLALYIKKIISSHNKAVPVYLYGELGSGKTTFCQGFAKELGISERLISPTYIVVRQYALTGSTHMLHHYDLYRLEKGGEANIGLYDILHDSSAIVLVEWSERLRDIPKYGIFVKCVAGESAYTITVENHL